MVNQISKVEIDIKKFAEKAKRKTETFLHEFSQDMAEEALRNTPVAETGFLRGSWFTSLNSTSSSSNSKNDKTGSTTLGDMVAIISGSEIGDTIYFLNQAVYAMRVEYGFVGTDSLGRKYTAENDFNANGRGYVRNTVAQADRIARETLARIRAT